MDPRRDLPDGLQDVHYPEEAPAHRVHVDGFWMDRTRSPTTLRRISPSQTGYVTVAERPPDPTDYPGADPALLVPGSSVFHRPPDPSTCATTGTGGPTCRAHAGAVPQAPDSTIARQKRPSVVHVA